MIKPVLIKYNNLIIRLFQQSFNDIQQPFVQRRNFYFRKLTFIHKLIFLFFFRIDRAAIFVACE